MRLNNAVIGAQPQAVPEPASLGLVGIGGLGSLLLNRRRAVWTRGYIRECVDDKIKGGRTRVLWMQDGGLIFYPRTARRG